MHRRGAYGLRLTGPVGSAELLHEAPDGWVPWHVEARSAAADVAADEGFVDERAALVPLQPAGRLMLDRERRTATIEAPDPPRGPEIVHPYLGAVGAVASHWLGRIALHAGAVELDGRAWGILADAGGGKSTLLAALAHRGHAVVADDLLVTAAGRALAGPACVDLRSDAARSLDVGEPIGRVGGRERFRVVTPRPRPELELAGFLTLTWSDSVSVRELPPVERLPRVAAGLAVALEPGDPTGLLALAALPMFGFERPRALETLDSSSGRLVASLVRSVRLDA